MSDVVIQLLVLVGLIGVAVFLIVSNKRDLDRVHNALLAEHSMSLTELDPENSFAATLKGAVIKTYRVSGIQNYSPDTAADSFNELSRFEQLNILAMALNEMGHSPVLRGAHWMPVKNPFGDRIDDALIESISKQLTEKHRAPVQLATGQFAVTEWGIADIKSSTGARADQSHQSSTSGEQTPSYAAERNRVIHTYKLQGYTALLVDKPSIGGPIEYIHALVVGRDRDSKTMFTVTAEKSFSPPGVEELLKDSEFFKDIDLPSAHGKGSVVLGILSDQGHENYGTSPDWANREKFAERALQLTKKKLGVND